MNYIDELLEKLTDLIKQGRFEPLETDTIEIKPVPPTGGDWKERWKSVCAFLNTRGGSLILGVKEEGKGETRRYVFKGWREEAEANLKEASRQFTGRNGEKLGLDDVLTNIMVRPLLTGQVAILQVDELPADRKYAYFEGVAYKRIATGDHIIGKQEIEAQEEFLQEADPKRELRPVEGTDLYSFDLDRINDYIMRLNMQAKIETLKPTLEAAVSFLSKKNFYDRGKATLLGILVCGDQPADLLGFRCQVHGYVDKGDGTVLDKQDFSNNILPLMESSFNYVLRNIAVGISPERGGSAVPQYPEVLLRETVNNALAHRDYGINRHVTISIRNGKSVTIENPGKFREHLLIKAPDDPIPIFRILPEAKPRNPKLADVLRLYRKWEGRGIGMSSLVNHCLENRIGVPYYILSTENVKLVIRSGALLDPGMERHLLSFDRHIEEKLDGRTPTEQQKLVLAYLLRSEWENQKHRYTILLTPDNNHFEELHSLEKAGLIKKHPVGTSLHPVYVADRVLAEYDPVPELRKIFGPTFDALKPIDKRILGVIRRHNLYSKSAEVSAKMASQALWEGSDTPGVDPIREFDSFYRQIRRGCAFLKEKGFIREAKKKYVLNEDFAKDRLL